MGYYLFSRVITFLRYLERILCQRIKNLLATKIAVVHRNIFQSQWFRLLTFFLTLFQLNIQLTMKNLTTILLFLGTISVFAQQKRQFFKNEATQSQMKVLHKNYSTFSKNQQGFSPNFTQTGSELYLEIPSKGYFTIEFAGQVSSNSTGKFLFFDVLSGRQPLSIYKEGYLVYRTWLHIPPANRLSFSFSMEEGLYLEESIFLSDNYTDVQPHLKPIFTDADFKIFKQKMNNQAQFDDEKIAFINQQLVSTSFTAHQIKELIEGITFKKLEMAKKLYHHCVDTHNYFVVLEAFPFSSEKKQLSEYISQQ